ncbi:threonine aldolase family protein [Armatimonas rosea]|uniref:Threonine aldolase n=1 Tax=Armatimonas rosea TaxID=685828 RepID=A0A7W9SSZ1_ARMRO|nr:GntG family PLP-dependent aldolase [Armatimonas rosea]MBB6052271.1 threonine aldolase [Armatimonas rosea]
MIDLYSDTKTKPTAAMRAAMAAAEVGDDHFGEDPSVQALQDFLADKLGKEAALFLPSATMANQLAVKLHTQLGDAVICHDLCHIRLFEGGLPAVLSGVSLDSVTGERGVFTGAQVREALRPKGRYFPPTRLVCVENTHNFCGGTVWSAEELDDVVTAARDADLGLHLDGSRLFNAAVKLGGVEGAWPMAARLSRDFDTVTICLTKGLGAPIGALLLGAHEQVEAARRWKHSLGGAMRQSGIVAAGGLHALQHHLPLLAADHDNAQRLAQGLAEIPGVALDPWPTTNLVFANVTGTGLSGDEARQRLRAVGVLSSGTGKRVRFVTHLDIGPDQISEAVAAAREAWRA